MSDQAIVTETPTVESPELHEAQRAGQPRDEAGRWAKVSSPEEEQAAADPPEQAEPEPEAAEAQADPGAEQEPEVELEEIEFEGKTYTIPKPLKGGFLMQADYTRKTQEVAEQRRALEAQAQEIAKRAQTSQEDMAREVALHAIDWQLQQFQATNWDQLAADNPTEATRQWMQFQSLRDQRNTIAQEVTQRQAMLSQEAEREMRQRLEATQEYAKKLPGWSPEMDLRIIEFAKSKGATEQEIRSTMNPTVYEILRLAEIGEQALKRQTASAKTPVAAAKPAKPTSTVSGRANPSAGKSLADMDMDEYAAYRQKQMAAG